MGDFVLSQLGIARNGGQAGVKLDKWLLSLKRNGLP